MAFRLSLINLTHSLASLGLGVLGISLISNRFDRVGKSSIPEEGLNWKGEIEQEGNKEKDW